MKRPAAESARFDAPLTEWFRTQGWKPAAFQREAWRRYLDGESGLLHTPTGSGKTLAAFGGPLLEALAEARSAVAPTRKRDLDRRPRVLWITPLRALAADTSRALSDTVAALGLGWNVAMRTGDASARDKRLARSGKAEVLVITPESDLRETDFPALLSGEGLFDDLRESFNLAELARRQFREVARVAGLLPPSLPGRDPRSMRQLQASSGLIYDVLRRYDPGHILLGQAEREVFAEQLDVSRLAEVLEACSRRELSLQRPKTLTPLSFPLWAETLRGQLSTEDWSVRIRRAAEKLELRHGG